MTTTNLNGAVFYGFGEAGKAFAKGLSGALKGRMSAYDLKAADAAFLPALQAGAADCGANLHDTPEGALAGAALAFCLVTADQAFAAASTAAAHGLPRGILWLDGNSCSPGTKKRSAEVIEAAGGRYVDMAIMAPVLPDMHRTPVLLGGPHANEAAGLLEALGMNVKVSGDRVGDASMLKMLRSIMIKGREALTAECILAARRAGVEDAVIASIQSTESGRDWRKGSAYNLERMMVHGKRRASEMREVAETLRELGLPDDMTQSTIGWQERVAALALTGGSDDLGDRADRILDKLG